MGLFRKTKKAPEGWIAVDALIDSVDRGRIDKVEMAMGSQERNQDKIKFLFEYVFPGPDGEVLRVPEKERRKRNESVKQGGRVTLAYNPENPEEIEVLENEHERNTRLSKEIKRYVEKGSEAPIVVTKVEETGRASAVSESNLWWGDSAAENASGRQVEKYLALKVMPPGGEEFEVTKKYWDIANLSRGSEGLLFYDPSDPENESYPLFPDPGMAAMGPAGLEAAKAQLLAGLSAV